MAALFKAKMEFAACDHADEERDRDEKRNIHKRNAMIAVVGKMKARTVVRLIAVERELHIAIAMQQIFLALLAITGEQLFTIHGNPSFLTKNNGGI